MRSSVETQMLLSQEQSKQLEQKLLDMDKEKQSLQEEKSKAVAAVEQEVMNSHVYYTLIFLTFLI